MRGATMNLNKKLLDFAIANDFYLIPFEENPARVVKGKDGILKKVGKKPIYPFRWQMPSAITQINQELKKAQDSLLIETDLDKQIQLQKEIMTAEATIKGIWHTANLNHLLSEYYSFSGMEAFLRENLAPHYKKYNKVVRAYDFAIRHSTYALRCDESKVLILDCDVKDHNGESSFPPPYNQCIGLDNLLLWFSLNKLPLSILTNTLTVRTASGGIHFIFRYDGDMKKAVDCFQYVKLSDSLDTGTKKSVDLVCGGNVAIAPYSLNLKYGSGARYLPVKLTITDDLEYSFIEYQESEEIAKIQPLDVNLEKCLRELPTPKNNTDRPFNEFCISVSEDYQKNFTLKANRIARQRVQKSLEALRQSQEGQRHKDLLKCTASIFTNYRYLDESATALTERILDIAVNTLDYPRAEAERDIKDAMNYGLEHQTTIV